MIRYMNQIKMNNIPTFYPWLFVGSSRVTKKKKLSFGQNISLFTSRSSSIFKVSDSWGITGNLMKHFP